MLFNELNPRCNYIFVSLLNAYTVFLLIVCNVRDQKLWLNCDWLQGRKGRRDRAERHSAVVQQNFDIFQLLMPVSLQLLEHDTGRE